MQQKLTILGTARRQGIGRQSGNPYDMGTLHTMQPARGRDANNIAAGYKSVEMGCPPELAMSLVSEKFPVEVMAQVELRDDGKLEVVSFERSSAVNSQAQK
ncbi:hypothetical protein [Zhongshania sp. BJYM1]|uniref:hypothetical protein n=1 Tax=Zhongshania aquatica TaxID=2965069 RepID=UPI0022B2AF51|nr:hypothetical protein [Marortus sp. BJYM1]